MKIKKRYLALCLFSCSNVYAEENRFWYLKATVGSSQMSDQSGQSLDVGGANGLTEVELDGGISPGLAMGYEFGNGWATELAWEYRSNDSQTTLADGTRFAQGNYASSVFAVNGYYYFDTASNWRPYIGGGLLIGQEIDIDLEQNGAEQFSFSGSGDTGYQAMIGVQYALNQKWRMNGEIRYGSFTGVNLEGEDNSGQINGLDYEPLTLGIGLQFNF